MLSTPSFTFAFPEETLTCVGDSAVGLRAGYDIKNVSSHMYLPREWN